MKKHLYKLYRKYWVHSDMCWCKGTDGNLKELKSYGYEYKYPHEASDYHCRCEPDIRTVGLININDGDYLKTCKVCGKWVD